MNDIIVVAFYVGVTFCLIFFLGFIHPTLRYIIVRRHVLQAIKALNLEDELARCPYGVSANLYYYINTYLLQHNMIDLFSYGGNFGLVMMIGELRKKSKIKKLYTVVNHN